MSSRPNDLTARAVRRARERRDCLFVDDRDRNLRGIIPESWHCIDCGTNTAPGLLNRVDMEIAIAALGDAWHQGKAINQHIDSDSEVYHVKDRVWSKAGIAS